MDARGVKGWSVFEYMYRDAGNWKTSGYLLLKGQDPRAEGVIRRALDWGDQFVAEQVQVPSLCPAHFACVGEGPSDLDHAYHEFIGIRAATHVELAQPPWGRLDRLIVAMARCRGRWDVSLSANHG